MTTARAGLVVITVAVLAPALTNAQDTASAARRDISFGGYLRAGSFCATVTVAGFTAADSVLGRQVKEHLRTLLGPATCSPTSSAFVTIMDGHTAKVFIVVFTAWHEYADGMILLHPGALGVSPVVGGLKNYREGDAASIALEALTTFRRYFEASGTRR